MFGLLILSGRILYSDPAGSTAERQSRSGNALGGLLLFSGVVRTRSSGG